MTNYRFPLWLYLYRLVGHNLEVAYSKLYSFFYRSFDKLELQWYLWRKNGDEKAYRIEKFAQVFKLNGSQHIDVILAAGAYLKRFGYKGETFDSFLLFFHYGGYNGFFFDNYRLMAAYLYYRIKDAGDIIEMAEALGLTDPVRAVRIFGKDEYDRMRTLSVTELYRLLQQESEQSN